MVAPTRANLYQAEKARHWYNTNTFGRKSVQRQYIIQNIFRQLNDLDLTGPGKAANILLRRQLVRILIQVSREMGPSQTKAAIAALGLKRDSDALFKLIEDAEDLSRKFPKIGAQAVIPAINPRTGAAHVAPVHRAGYAAVQTMTSSEVKTLKAELVAFKKEIMSLSGDDLLVFGTDTHTLKANVEIALNEVEERVKRLDFIGENLRAQLKGFFQMAQDTATYPVAPRGGYVGGNPLFDARERLLENLNLIDGDDFKGTDKQKTIQNIGEAFNSGHRVKKERNSFDAFDERDIALSDFTAAVKPTGKALGASIAATFAGQGLTALSTGATGLLTQSGTAATLCGGAGAVISGVASYGGLPLVALYGLYKICEANYRRGGKLHELLAD